MRFSSDCCLYMHVAACYLHAQEYCPHLHSELLTLHAQLSHTMHGLNAVCIWGPLTRRTAHVYACTSCIAV